MSQIRDTRPQNTHARHEFVLNTHGLIIAGICCQHKTEISFYWPAPHIQTSRTSHIILHQHSINVCTSCLIHWCRRHLSRSQDTKGQRSVYRSPSPRMLRVRFRRSLAYSPNFAGSAQDFFLKLLCT